jgi:hypothetical protein
MSQRGVTSDQKTAKKALKPRISVSGSGGKPLTWGHLTWQKKQLYSLIDCLSFCMHAVLECPKETVECLCLMVWCLLSNLKVRGAPWLSVMGELKWAPHGEQQIAASCAALAGWADDG